MTFGPDRTFEVVIGGPKRAGNWIPLDARRRLRCVTRDYLVDPAHGAAGDATRSRRSRARAAAGAAHRRRHWRSGSGCTANFIRDLLNISPDPDAVRREHRAGAVHASRP